MLDLNELEEYNNCETYVHATHGNNISGLKAHALEVGKVELVGRDDLHKEDDYEFVGFNAGIIYALPFADRDNTTEYMGNHGVQFVLGYDLGSNEADYSYEKGEAIVPLDSYKVIAVIDENNNVYEPMEWAKN